MHNIEDRQEIRKHDKQSQSDLGAILLDLHSNLAPSANQNQDRSLPSLSIEETDNRIFNEHNLGRRAASILESSTDPVSRAYDKWWSDRHDQLAKQVDDSHCKVAFYGDSITDWMNVDLMHKIIGDDASNFGIAGDRTQHLLWRLRNGEMNFPGPGPEAFVLLIGTNNLGQPGNPGNKNHDIYEGVNADVKEIHKHFPDAKILVLGILPRDEQPNTDFRKRIHQTNEMIKGLADDKHVFYADISNAFLEPDGSISPEVMSDYLHPTKDEGYQRMFTAIKPHLDEIMKSASN